VSCELPHQPAIPGKIILTEDDDGTKVKLIRGQVLEASLEGNPTTGYTWEVEELNERVLQQLGSEFKPQSNLPGAPGTVTFRFKAVGKGQAQLKLIYHRPWEKATPPKTFSIRLVVR